MCMFRDATSKQKAEVNQDTLLQVPLSWKIWQYI